MMMPAYPEEKPETYKSYKAKKFSKYADRQRALIRGVLDSSLKDEDKKKLLGSMAAEILSHSVTL